MIPMIPGSANVVVGQYVLEKALGAGGLGEVWLARNQRLGTPVAVKFLNRQYGGNAAIEQRFLEEARRQGSLNHPGVVKIYGFENAGGRNFLILQYIAGESLESLLRRVRRLAPNDMLRIAGPVLDALESAHKQGVLHRNIKPANILLDTNGYPYMSDFGLVLSPPKQRMTNYMSPEQITTPENMDYRSDLYSFGCVLYEMLTGQPPFAAAAAGAANADSAIMMAHVQQAPRPPRELNPAIAPELDRVVMRCLAKDPNYRPQSAAKLKEALGAAMLGMVAPPMAPGVGPGLAPAIPPNIPPNMGPGAQMAQYLPPTAKTSRLGPGIAVLLVIAALGGWYWYRNHRASVTVEDVAVCQGIFTDNGTCERDASSRQLTVVAKFHGAKAGQSSLRDEWEFGGKVLQKAPDHVVSAESGVYYRRFGVAIDPGDYKVTVYADNVKAGSAAAHIGSNAGTFVLDRVEICKGKFDTSSGACANDDASNNLTAVSWFHGATPGEVTMRTQWELPGHVIKEPDPHVLKNDSGFYWQQLTADTPGNYKVTIFANGTPVGNATADVGGGGSAVAVDSLSICQGTFDGSRGTCQSDPSSRQLTVVLHFHGAVPSQTTASNNWAFNGQVVQATGNPYALRYEHGFYYDNYTAAVAGEYSSTVFLNGAPAGTARIRIGP